MKKDESDRKPAFNLKEAWKKVGGFAKWAWKKHRVKTLIASSLLAAAVDEAFIKQGPTHNHSVSPEVKKAKDLWSITVSHMRLPSWLEFMGITGTPGIPDPVHNFINVRNPDGKLILSFHGLTTDPDTRLPDVFSLFPGNTLRAYPMPITASKALVDLDGGIESDIFCGSHEDTLRKVAICFDACHFMNEQSLAYSTLTQNSNSVAYTLVKAMGQKFPAENKGFLAPGHGKWLLPNNWKSIYDSKQYRSIFADHFDHYSEPEKINIDQAQMHNPDGTISLLEVMKIGNRILHPSERFAIQVIDQLKKTPVLKIMHDFDPDAPIKPYRPVKKMMPFEELSRFFLENMSKEQRQQLQAELQESVGPQASSSSAAPLHTVPHTTPK